MKSSPTQFLAAVVFVYFASVFVMTTRAGWRQNRLIKRGNNRWLQNCTEIWSNYTPGSLPPGCSFTIDAENECKATVNCRKRGGHWDIEHACTAVRWAAIHPLLEIQNLGNMSATPTTLDFNITTYRDQEREWRHRSFQNKNIPFFVEMTQYHVTKHNLRRLLRFIIRIGAHGCA